MRHDFPADPLFAVDARALAGPIDGISRWTREMIPRLASRLPGRWLMASHAPIPLPPPFDRPPFEPLAGKLGLPGTVWLQTELPRRLSRAGATLLVAPLNVLPLRGRTPAVLVLHDLTPLTTPHRHTLKVRTSLLPFWGASLRRAALVVTPSEATARELASLDPGLGERLGVVPNGVDPAFAPAGGGPGEAESVRRRFTGGRPFVLSVGTLEPRKDQRSLVAAMEDLWLRSPDAPDLLLAGRPGWKCEPLLDRIRGSRFAARIHLAGHVEDEALPSLYRAAELFVFPSLDEGFGLPLLEGMASGCPCVARDIPASREVAGDDGALLVRGDGEAGLVAALTRLLGSAPLRRELAAAGPKRAAAFSWDASADRLAGRIRRLLDSPEPRRGR